MYWISRSSPLVVWFYRWGMHASTERELGGNGLTLEIAKLLAFRKPLSQIVASSRLTIGSKFPLIYMLSNDQRAATISSLLFNPTPVDNPRAQRTIISRCQH